MVVVLFSSLVFIPDLFLFDAGLFSSLPSRFCFDSLSRKLDAQFLFWMPSWGPILLDFDMVVFNGSSASQLPALI